MQLPKWLQKKEEPHIKELVPGQKIYITAFFRAYPGTFRQMSKEGKCIVEDMFGQIFHVYRSSVTPVTDDASTPPR